jgi:hypothetical protein
MQEAIRAVDRIRDWHNARASAVRRQRTLSSAMNCGRSGSSSASQPRLALSLRLGAGWAIPRGASPNSSRLPVTKPRLASGSTRTCSGMPAARRSPIKASGPEFRRCGSNAPQATQQMNRPLFDPEHLRIAAEVRAKAWRRRWLNVAGGLLVLLIVM